MPITRRFGLLAAGLAATCAVTITGCAAVPAPQGPSIKGDGIDATDAARATTLPGSAVVTWYRQVEPRITAAERAVRQAQHAVGRPGLRGLDAACLEISRRAHVALAARPAPDPVEQRAYHREMSALVRAGTSCTAGDLDAAGRGVDLAEHWSRVADARLRHLVRHSG